MVEIIGIEKLVWRESSIVIIEIHKDIPNTYSFTGIMHVPEAKENHEEYWTKYN